MRTRRTLGVALSAALLLTAARCPGGGGTTNTAQEAMTAGKAALKGETAVDDVLRQRKTLSGLPRDDFSTDDWKVRHDLVRRLDSLMMTSEISKVDRLVAQSTETARANAAFIATEATTVANPDPTFISDFAEVTKDGLVSVACGKILDSLAPDERPPVAGEVSTAEETVDEAVTKLAVSWAPNYVRAAVDWGYYVASVKKDAEQVAQAIGGYSTEEYPNPNPVTLLAKPQVREAAIVYLRTCYTPPKRP